MIARPYAFRASSSNYVIVCIQSDVTRNGTHTMTTEVPKQRAWDKLEVAIAR